MQRGDTGGSEVVGVDMVAEDIIGLAQGRKGLIQAFDRQAGSRIDAWRTQDGDRHTGAQPPGAQGTFGIDPPGSP